MLAKFEIIKIHCIGKVKYEKLEDEKERVKRHGFTETEINYFKKRDIIIIFEETTNLKIQIINIWA